LSESAFRTVASDLGRYLARLHTVDAVEAFGYLAVADESRAGSVPPADPETLRVVDPESEWRARVRADADDGLSRLAETRFGDLRDPLAAVLDDMPAALTGPFRPALAHVDASPENHCWDPEAERLTGVLDWAFTVAAPPGYDLAYAGQTLGGGHWTLLPDRPDRRDEAFEAVLAGYLDAEPEPGGPLERADGSVVVGQATDGTRLTTERVVEQARANRDVYRRLMTVRTCNLFEGWFDWWGVEAWERAAAAEMLRERVERLIAEA